MSRTFTDDALRAIELAWFNLNYPPLKASKDQLRHDFQASILVLREFITPRGDPLFVQIGPSKLPLQVLVLAGECFMRRGWPDKGPANHLFEAALVAAKEVAEETAR